MRAQALDRPQRVGEQTAVVVPMDAPIGGWNARDPLNEMGPLDAHVLDNWYPSTNAVNVRDGYTSHATGVGSTAVKTVVEYRGEASDGLIACSDSTIYDATAAGAATSLASGFTSGRWEATNFQSYLYMVNGTDTPQRYDGTNVSATPLTAVSAGLSAKNLNNVALVYNRLWFTENNKGRVWYTDAGAIQGTLNKFDLDQVANGGYCLAIGSWSQDSGDGMDDFHVFVMSTGEILVYGGDISSTFTLQGRYRTGEPIGRRCLVKQGGQLIVITRAGYMPLTAIMAGLNQHSDAVSDKIRNAVRDATRLYDDNEGWQAFLSPKGDMLLFNVPRVEDSDSEQHVMNTVASHVSNTGEQENPWARWTIPASSWGSYNAQMYFGGFDGTVYKMDGSDDNGDNIIAVAKTAFTGLGGDAQYKRVTQARILMRTDGSATASLYVNADFSDNKPASFPNTTIASLTDGSDWDTADWDVATWGSPAIALGAWVSQGARGYKFSTYFEVRTKAQVMEWFRVDYRGQVGGPV